MKKKCDDCGKANVVDLTYNGKVVGWRCNGCGANYVDNELLPPCPMCGSEIYATENGQGEAMGVECALCSFRALWYTGRAKWLSE